MIKYWIPYIMLFVPVLSFSQSSEKTFASKDSLVPGSSTSVSFMIENKSDVKKNFLIKVQSSHPYIIPILQENHITISPNSSTVYLVPLRITGEAPQGIHSIIIEGFHNGNAETFVKKRNIIISGKRNLSFTLLNVPEFTKAGEMIRASFMLKNTGNVEEHIIIESKNAVTDTESSLILAPGDSKIIHISKQTQANLKKNEFQNLHLAVYPIGNPQQVQTLYATTQLIATQPEREDIYHRFPVSVSGAFVSMKNRGKTDRGFQGEIYGKGSLDKNGKGVLEFRGITKNPVEFNSFTPYEEYFINYKQDHLWIHLGDKTYSASYLTEFARYGRGAEVRFDFNKVSLGGFYNHPRFFRDIKEEFNMYSKVRIGKESEVSAGYLYKIPRKNPDVISMNNVVLKSEAHLPYVAGKFKISPQFTFSNELAYSSSGHTEGTAYLLQIQANLTRLTGSALYMKASPRFAGYFTNTSTFNGNLQYKLSKKLNIFANYVQDARNFQRDTLFLSAPYRKFMQYGIQYHYLKSGSLRFMHGLQRYEDRLEPKEFDYSERFLRAGIDQRLGIFQISTEAQFGRTKNFLTGFTGNSSFYTFNVSFEKLRTAFNLYGSYSLTSRYQYRNQEQFNYGIRMISRFSEKTYFSVFYQNNYLPEEYFRDRNLFEVLFHQQILPGHDMDISGRYTLQRGELGHKDFIVSARYTLRMNVPVSRTAEYVTLQGNIRNLGVQKVDGIRLLLGRYLTITDKNGDFIFRNVVPGDYFLSIDRATAGLHDIPDVSFPALLHLINKENIYNFGLVSAAGIRGKIVFREQQVSFTQVQLKSPDTKKTGSIILEASNGEQVYRKVAMLGENFDFTYLRPGDWNVRVYRNGLDKRYKIVSEEFKLNLKSSEIKDLRIDVFRQPSEVKYQQESIKVGYN